MTYLDWLAIIAFPDGEQRSLYSKVLTRLYEVDFFAILPRDENRAKDGESLREEYEELSGECCEKSGPCSVLEMMVALAARCESQIMFDPDEGDRTDLWFWEMFDNLGLSCLYGDRFDEREFRRIIVTFLNRKFGADGYLGPFYIPDFEGDMRKIELWYQLGYYIESKFL